MKNKTFLFFGLTSLLCITIISCRTDSLSAPDASKYPVDVLNLDAQNNATA